MQDAPKENFKTLKDTEKDMKNQKGIPCSWIGCFNIIKVSIQVS